MLGRNNTSLANTENELMLFTVNKDAASCCVPLLVIDSKLLRRISTTSPAGGGVNKNSTSENPFMT